MRRVVRSATLSAALAISLGVVTPAAAAPPTTPTTPDQTGQANPGGDSHVVTLLTGDKIRVDRDANGNARATVVRSAPGTSTYAMVPADDALYVLPDEALAPLAAGTLDRRLFDVAGLVEQGYDDESVDELPVIVQRDQGIAPQSAPTFTESGARLTGDLPVVDATALEVDKEHASQFWSAAVAGPHLAGGVNHIWLDAKVRGTLDRSVPQIGGDVAHERGLDGDGVTVAVIDSGIDTSHPDLADQVVAGHNFTDEPDADDHVGHGTHVASIVAGTGAASGGKYSGVAPGADLINAKALELAIVDPGLPVATGQESWIISAMQWAVDQGADIVNMSLGNASADGNDPLSVALNDLTESSGALFVVAAGNTGFGQHYTVGSPATADLALAVGSVDRDDSISFFSSLGPRMIDGAVKPEITAPGDQIVAARAADARIGRPVDDHYAKMSGTSMAAPHVAGSAALLLQRHPDWTWEQLRAGLVSTAAFNPDYLVYDQGGGRVDIDRATRQDVRVDAGTLNMGYFRAETPPEEQHASQTVTYHNDSDSPVDLTLTTTATHQSGDEAEPGTITVEPEQIQVPAGGSATATVTAVGTDREPGAYSGRVLATGPDGLELGTPVGFFKQNPELVDYTFRALDRRGDPTNAFVILRNPRLPFAFWIIAVPPGGSFTMRLELGDYSILGVIQTPDASGRFNSALTVVADPEFEAVQPNRTITLDARDAQPLSVRVPREVDVAGLSVGLEIRRPELGDLPLHDSFVFTRGPLSGGSLPAVPMSILRYDPPERGHGDLDIFWSLVEPRLRASVVSPHRFSLDATLMDFSAPVDGEERLTVVDAGTGTPDDLAGKDFSGKVALLRESPDMTYKAQAQAVADAGAVAAIISSAQPGLFYGQAFVPIPVLAVQRDDGDRIRDLLGGRRPVTVKLTGTSVASYQYDLALREHDRLPRDTTYRFGWRDLAQLNVSYHSAQSDPPTRFVSHRFPAFDSVCGYCGFGARMDQDWRGVARHTEYVSPGVTWNESVLQDGVVWWHAERSYERGRESIAWGRAPVAPGVPIELGVRSTRVGDQLRLRLAGLTDGGEPTTWNRASRLFGRHTELARDGEVIGECARPWLLWCDVNVPAESATYTLSATMPKISSSVAVPPSTTTWTFHSGHPDGDDPATLPLIDLDYRVPVSIHNTEWAGSVTMMEIRARHQPGASAPPVSSVRMRFSGDDGEHWRDAFVWRVGRDRYLAFYRNPSMDDSNGTVSIHVTAKDRAGNSIDQEVMRAYGLSGR